MHSRSSTTYVLLVLCAKFNHRNENEISISSGYCSISSWGIPIFLEEQLCKRTIFLSRFSGMKIEALQAFPLSRVRRKEYEELLNETELKAFGCLNTSIGWLGVAASPSCGHAAWFYNRKGKALLSSTLLRRSTFYASLRRWVPLYRCFPGQPVQGI